MNREHPNCTERNSLNYECGWKGGDRGGSAGRKRLWNEKNVEKSKKLLTGIGLLMEGLRRRVRVARLRSAMNCRFLWSFLFLSYCHSWQHFHLNPRWLFLRVIHALRRFHEIRRLGLGNIDERLRIPVCQRKPRALHLYH